MAKTENVWGPLFADGGEAALITRASVIGNDCCWMASM